ncbi:MAG: ATP-binding protein [Candidatus Nanoarchaeia archaeon]
MEIEYIERDIRERFNKISKTYKIIALVGARQAGKTTFLKNKIKQSNAEYVFFDDPDAIELFEQDIKKFESQYLNKEITILDEVQNCKAAGKKLKYLADSGYKLWITSSSEIILSKEILSHLVGRVSILKLYPFSITEFLRARNQKQTTKKLLQREIYNHCLYGGYPKIVLTNDIETKKIINEDLYQTMVLKDIANTFSIDDIESLKRFVKYLSHNIGGQISYEKISSNLNLSFQTIKKYLQAMEKSYLIYNVTPFYQNKIKEISKQPKIYFIDTGLRNHIAKQYPSSLTGELFENYIFSELLKSGHEPKYWRTKNKSEVAFIIETNNSLIPIEVKLKAQQPRKSLRNFIRTYNPKKAIIVNYEGINKKIKQDKCQIIYADVLNLLQHIREEA